MPEAKVHKLVELCRTRWIRRVDALYVFQDLHVLEATVAALHLIKSKYGRSWNAVSLAEVNGLYHNIFRFEFLMTLTVCCKCLGYLRNCHG